MLLLRAAGGLLWRDSPLGPKIAVVHRPRHRDWSLPKGKLEHRESWRAAALREVAEETSCRARITGFAGTAMYCTGLRPKLVLYWRMALESEGAFVPGEEIDALAWLTREEALARLDHASERRLVGRRGWHV
jgi:8-oxo-dGTP pyrophosphatase MutT (NUDIX family)